MATTKKTVKKAISNQQLGPNVDRASLLTALEKYFGFNEFKGTQEPAILSLMSGRDTFVIMPTGGGKSLCYQLPALMLPGCAIVVSPLIALIPAIACSSSEPNEDNLNVPDAKLMRNADYKQAYVDQSHKIKKRKIWKNFGIGSGIWLGLLVLAGSL